MSYPTKASSGHLACGVVKVMPSSIAPQQIMSTVDCEDQSVEDLGMEGSHTSYMRQMLSLPQS